MRLDLGPSLAALKEQLMACVDAGAEAARLRFITPGAGQALEYQATEREARAWLSAEAPQIDDYPFLKAEVLAVQAATGMTPDPTAVAADVVSQADAWQAVGSEIKRLRRAAKLAIEAAVDAPAARAAAQVTWPAP